MGLLMTDYIPYGLPHATSVSPATNRRKFGGKELATELGLNLHDFTARWQNPALGRFTTPDPLSEKYCHISLYSFCAGDPINYIDPTGMIVDTSGLSPEELEIWENQIKIFCDKSPILFNTLYQWLESPTITIYVKFGKTSTDSDGKNVPADFNSGNNTITISPNVTPAGINIPLEDLSEEMFHAYQNNSDVYAGVNINLEFEAKTFKKLVLIEANYPLTNHEIPRGLFDIVDNLYSCKYGEDISEIFQEIRYDNSQFSKDYKRYADMFINSCIMYDIGNDNYRVPNKSLPIGIQSILKRVFNF